MSIRPQFWSLAAATFCLSLAGGAHAQITATSSSTGVSCHGGSNGVGTVTPSGGVGPYSYIWVPQGGSAATASGLPAGTYNVIISDGTTSLTQPVTIVEPSLLGGNVSKTDATSALAADGSATVTASGGTAPYTYSWAPSGGTAATATGLTQGAYSVTVTDDNGCVAMANTNVGVGVVAPVAVPTLTEWAMILLTGLLALFGAARLGFLPAARKD